MLNITFEKTHIERTGDISHPFQFNRSQEHQERVDAHCARVQREYFDSGLYYRETHKAQEKPKLIRDGRSRD